MIIVVKGTRQYANAQLIKRKIYAANDQIKNPNEHWFNVTEKFRPKIIAWFAEENSSLLWYSEK